MTRYSLLFLLLCCGTLLSAQIELSGSAGLNAGYAPWSTWENFRKEYNSVNDNMIARQLGTLSDLYGYQAGAALFIGKHYYSSVEYHALYSRATARFDNDTRRKFGARLSTVYAYIGWKEVQENSSWTIAGAFGASFGHIESWLHFPDGTEYHSTEGFSGNFSAIALGFGLKFEYEKPLTERLGWRLAGQVSVFGKELSSTNNDFFAKTAYSISLNDQTVTYQPSMVSTQFSFYYRFLKA